MNRHTLKKPNKLLWRMLALLLAVLVLSGSSYAPTDDKELRELYGDDWQEVAALQPGESYISGETMYVCHEQIYVDWTRVRKTGDLDWGSGDRLLLMTSTDGKNLFVGNDYADARVEIEDTEDQVILRGTSPTSTREVISGVTTDTSGKNGAEYVEELVFPEMNEYIQNSTGGYPYPDEFRTMGTMNAPYIRPNGIDVDNGNFKRFKIIVPKDDGTISAVALGTGHNNDRLELVSLSATFGFTIYFEGSGFKVFENVDIDDDLLLRVNNGRLFGKDYESLEEMPLSELVLYVGKSTVGKRIEVISLALEDAEQDPNALENVYGGAIEFYHWEKVSSYDQLPTDSKTYRALLIWDNTYYLQGDDFRRKSTSYSKALYVNEEDTKGGAAPGNVAQNSCIDLDENEFYTLGGLGTPYLKFSHKDGNKNNDDCPYYTFQLAGVDDRPSGKWLCDGDNKLEICLGKISNDYGGMGVGIVVGRSGESKHETSPGKVRLFFNESSGYDTGFIHEGNILSGYGDGDWEDYSEFTLYIGTPVVYPAIRQNYVVGEDQFMHISQNGAMLKNVTVTVKEGGVLSVESWFMNNGRIIVDGGTLIVQNASNPLGNEEDDDTEDSIMMPFADIHENVSGILELKNGGELIVLKGARAAFSNITATTGSSIFNNGMLLAETVTLQESTMDIREGTYTFVGYNFRKIVPFRTGSVSKIMNALTSRLHKDIASASLGMYSGIYNEGTVNYATRFTYVEHESVQFRGNGSYVELPGN